MVQVAPAASVTASSNTLAVSRQTMLGHSSSAKSGMAAALALQGFHTTVLAEPALATVMVRLPTASMIVAVEVESYTRSVSPVKATGPTCVATVAGSAGRAVEIPCSVKTLDLDSRDIPDVTVGVQRLLEGILRVACIANRQSDSELGTKRHDERQLERVLPSLHTGQSGDVGVGQAQGEGDGAVDVLGCDEQPVGQTSKSMRGCHPRLAAGAEPGKANGHAAADGRGRCKQACLAHPNDRVLLGRRPIGNMGAVQIQLTGHNRS